MQNIICINWLEIHKKGDLLKMETIETAHQSPAADGELYIDRSIHMRIYL